MLAARDGPCAHVVKIKPVRRACARGWIMDTRTKRLASIVRARAVRATERNAVLQIYSTCRILSVARDGLCVLYDNDLL